MLVYTHIFDSWLNDTTAHVTTPRGQFINLLVLEGEVERLGWEIPNHIGQITTPES